MNVLGPKKRRSWWRKFADAIRGVVWGVRGENSFVVHALCAIAVVILAASLPGVTRTDWCLLILCISAVMAAELFNSALERLAAAVHPDEHPQVGAALDIASGAVLVGALGAAVTGLMILGPPLLDKII